MIWVIIPGLACVIVALRCWCEGLEERLDIVTDERDQALAHYDCLAGRYEDLLEATQPDADVWADGAVETDELQDALIPAHEAAELEKWIGPLDLEQG